MKVTTQSCLAATLLSEPSSQRLRAQAPNIAAHQASCSLYAASLGLMAGHGRDLSVFSGDFPSVVTTALGSAAASSASPGILMLGRRHEACLSCKALPNWLSSSSPVLAAQASLGNTWKNTCRIQNVLQTAHLLTASQKRPRATADVSSGVMTCLDECMIVTPADIAWLTVLPSS